MNGIREMVLWWQLLSTYRLPRVYALSVLSAPGAELCEHVRFSCPFTYSDLSWAMKISKGLKQAYDVQDFAYATLMAMKESLSSDGKLVLTRDDATAISHLVRAWQAAQER